MQTKEILCSQILSEIILETKVKLCFLYVNINNDKFNLIMIHCANKFNKAAVYGIFVSNIAVTPRCRIQESALRH